jgi:hypothetical protein
LLITWPTFHVEALRRFDTWPATWQISALELAAGGRTIRVISSEIATLELDLTPGGKT